MSGEHRGDLSPYLVLFHDFLESRMSALGFESAYLTLFKGDLAERGPAVFAVLNRVFLDVDEYVDDDDLRRQAGGLDEAELRTSVSSALHQLETSCTSTTLKEVQ